MEPKDLTATILFTDIIGFTRLAEQMPPREMNMILNEYFSRMTDIIFHYDGTLDKYIGDGLMAVFGAPMEKEGDAERAILTAQEMRRALAEMRNQAGEDRQINIRIGIKEIVDPLKKWVKVQGHNNKLLKKEVKEELYRLGLTEEKSKGVDIRGKSGKRGYKICIHNILQ